MLKWLQLNVFTWQKRNSDLEGIGLKLNLRQQVVLLLPSCLTGSFFWVIWKEWSNIERVAVLTAILENPQEVQEAFNRIIASYQSLVIGRMGLPLSDKGISIVCVTLCGNMDEINSLNGQLGKLKEVHSKLTVSKKEF